MEKQAQKNKPQAVAHILAARICFARICHTRGDTRQKTFIFFLFARPVPFVSSRSSRLVSTHFACARRKSFNLNLVRVCVRAACRRTPYIHMHRFTYDKFAHASNIPLPIIQLYECAKNFGISAKCRQPK